MTAAATPAGVVAASGAAVTFVLVNHALLARMLRLARGHDISASGLFSLDGLIQDGVVAAVGVGVAFMLLHSCGARRGGGAAAGADPAGARAADAA